MSRSFIAIKEWKSRGKWRWAVLDLGYIVRQGDAKNQIDARVRANNAKADYLESLSRHTRSTPLNPVAATT